MPEPTYWVDLYSVTAWQEFLDAGAHTAGFGESTCKTVQAVQPGDILLGYLIHVGRWIAVLQVTKGHFHDTAPIWSGALYPCRLGVNVVTKLDVDTALPLHDLQGQLSICPPRPGRTTISAYLRRSPTRLPEQDGAKLVALLQDAEARPVHRTVSKAKLEWKPKVLQTGSIGQVTVPDNSEQSESSESPRATPAQPSLDSDREHTEIQWRLLELGSEMGLDVWVAKNDKGRSYKGRPFGSLPKLKDKLPLQFDEATNRTIELIDVLWLKGNTIVGAFEIESSTSIYSGLLRMSDLVTMQPNLNIDLYLVAPDERRGKVLSEVNRPTFSRLAPPLNRICRLIVFSSLRSKLDELGPSVIKHLRPEYVRDELSESCVLDTV